MIPDITYRNTKKNQKGMIVWEGGWGSMLIWVAVSKLSFISSEMSYKMKMGIKTINKMKREVIYKMEDYFIAEIFMKNTWIRTRGGGGARKN